MGRCRLYGRIIEMDRAKWQFCVSETLYLCRRISLMDTTKDKMCSWQRGQSVETNPSVSQWQGSWAYDMVTILLLGSQRRNIDKREYANGQLPVLRSHIAQRLLLHPVEKYALFLISHWYFLSVHQQERYTCESKILIRLTLCRQCKIPLRQIWQLDRGIGVL